MTLDRLPDFLRRGEVVDRPFGYQPDPELDREIRLNQGTIYEEPFSVDLAIAWAERRAARVLA